MHCNNKTLGFYLLEQKSYLPGTGLAFFTLRSNH